MIIQRIEVAVKGKTARRIGKGDINHTNNTLHVHPYLLLLHHRQHLHAFNLHLLLLDPPPYLLLNLVLALKTSLSAVVAVVADTRVTTISSSPWKVNSSCTCTNWTTNQDTIFYSNPFSNRNPLYPNLRSYLLKPSAWCWKTLWKHSWIMRKDPIFI